MSRVIIFSVAMLFFCICIARADAIYPRIEVKGIEANAAMIALAIDKDILVFDKVRERNENMDMETAVGGSVSRISYDGRIKEEKVITLGQGSFEDIYEFISVKRTKNGFLLISHQYFEQSGYYLVSLLDEHYCEIKRTEIRKKAILDIAIIQNGLLLVGSVYDGEQTRPWAMIVNDACEVEWEYVDQTNANNARFLLCGEMDGNICVIQESETALNMGSQYSFICSIGGRKTFDERIEFGIISDKQMNINTLQEGIEKANNTQASILSTYYADVLDFYIGKQGIYIVVGRKSRIDMMPIGMSVVCYDKNGVLLWEIESKSGYPTLGILEVTEKELICMVRDLDDISSYSYMMFDLLGEGVWYQRQHTNTWLSSATFLKKAENEIWLFGGEYGQNCFINQITK